MVSNFLTNIYVLKWRFLIWSSDLMLQCYKASWKLGKLYSPKTRVGMISGLSKFTRNKAWVSQVKRAKFDVEYDFFTMKHFSRVPAD